MSGRYQPVPYPALDGSQLCSQTDPELFFPRSQRDRYFFPQQTEPLCADCPFLNECRDYALSYDVHGFWGGMTETQRRVERERLGIDAIPFSAGDTRMLHRLLEELDDGTESSARVAARVGCAPDTVLRNRRRRLAAEPEVA